ncbi:hypothetical protein ACWEVP_31910 [Amycolatopsis sp. NPDC003865]
MSGIKLSGAMPEGERNGLAVIAPALAENPKSVHVAVVLLDCSKRTESVDSGDIIPTVRIRAIEVVGDHETDAKELRRLLRRAHERRTGRVELPLDLENELESLGAPEVDGAAEVPAADDEDTDEGGQW